MFPTGLLSSFTWFLRVSSAGPLFHLHGFLHVSYGPPFFIYMVFTGLQT